MTIEQRPELNRLIDPSIIAPWKYRWSLIRPLLPIVLGMFIFFGEWGLFFGWLAGDFRLAATLTGIGLFIALSPLLLIAIFMRILAAIFYLVNYPAKFPVKEEITFNEDKIILGPDGRSVKWDDVYQFQFAPIAEASSLTKFSLSRLSSRKKRKTVLCQLVIENPVQARKLMDYLYHRKAAGSFNYDISVLDHPAPLFKPQLPFLSDLAGATGMVIFMDGMLILLDIFDSFHLNRFVKWQRFITHYFSSPAEFHLYCLVLGASLAVAGFWLQRWYKNKESRVRTLAD